jgi:hypothetical protein
MSDFLTRLAVRALQRPSLVPRLPARFDAQPMELKELHEEIVAAPLSQPPTPTPAEAVTPLPAAMDSDSNQRITPTAAAVRPDIPAGAHAPPTAGADATLEEAEKLMERPPIPVALVPLLVAPDPPRSASAALPDALNMHGPEAPTPGATAEPTQPLSPSWHRIEHTLRVEALPAQQSPNPTLELRTAPPPSASTRPASSQALETHSDPAPLHVEVTIGRIEISSPPVPAPLPPAARSTAPPPMGLDEHLRRRRGVPT